MVTPPCIIIPIHSLLLNHKTYAQIDGTTRVGVPPDGAEEACLGFDRLLGFILPGVVMHETATTKKYNLMKFSMH